jgi:hypothetical protein
MVIHIYMYASTYILITYVHHSFVLLLPKNLKPSHL